MTVRSVFARLRWPPALVLVALPAPVLACGFCANLDGNPLALPHPKAIEIAVATRAAIEKDHPNPKRLVPHEVLFEGGRGTTALHKLPAPLLVKAWARKCRCPSKNGSPWNAQLVFIDTEETCGLTVRAGGVWFETGPFPHNDARLVTTRTTFGALFMGNLSLQEARARGLVYLEGDARAASLLPGAE